MTQLTRDQILAAEDLKTTAVDVPEWGGAVTVSEMSGTAREAYETMLFDKRGKMTEGCLRARLVAASVVDGDGALMFSPKDVDALARKSAQALHRVYDAALHISGIHKDAVKDKAKN